MSGIVTTREQRRQLERDNAKMPVALQEVPRGDWPAAFLNSRRLLRVLRGRNFLVQVYEEDAPALVRLSINRTTLSGDRWAENIPWDDLQWCKAQCGYGGHDAVEVFPAAIDVVNVANMRHLWVMSEPLPFAWRRRAG